MSKKEIYAWSSLASSLVLLGFYLIAVFGWPESLENYGDYITGLFWKVLGIAILVEVVLDLMRDLNIGEVHRDERDMLIESKGYRNAYYLLMVAIFSLAINLLISDLASEAASKQMFLAIPFMALHVLVIVLFAANITKSTTQLYYYLKS